jgi:transcriptional regulator
MPDAQSSSTLLRGSVDLLVLRALAGGEMHGFEMARWIRDRGDDVVQFEDAALYQSLHRLRRQGLVSSRWGRSENNRRARFYELTEKGRAQLEARTEEFRSFTRVMTRLLDRRTR